MVWAQALFPFRSWCRSPPADGAIEAGLGNASVFPQAALEFAVEDGVSCRVQEVCQGQPAFVDGFCSGGTTSVSPVLTRSMLSPSTLSMPGAVPFYFVEGLEGAILADGDLSFFVFDVFCCQAGICFVFDDFVAWDKRTVGVGYGFLSSVEVDGAVVEVGFLVFCQGDDGTIFAQGLAGQVEVDGLEFPDVLGASGVVFDVQGVSAGVVIICFKVASIEPSFCDVDSVCSIQVDGVAGDGSAIAVACISFSCNLPSVEVVMVLPVTAPPADWPPRIPSRTLPPFMVTVLPLTSPLFFSPAEAANGSAYGSSFFTKTSFSVTSPAAVAVTATDLFLYFSSWSW